MIRNILFMAAMLLPSVLLSQVLENGKGETFFKDDFETLELYPGIYYWNNTGVTLSRTSQDLRVDATSAGYDQVFGVTFGEGDYLNLTFLPELRISAMNPGTDTILLNIGLIDKDNKIAATEKDTSTGKHNIIFELLPGQNEIIVNLDGIHAG